MLILTFKARRLINQAVNAYGNDHQREIWRSFAAAHPEVRRGPADPYEDGKGGFSPEVADVARSVLNQMFSAIQLRLKEGLSEDEVADLNNDLAFVRSVVKTLNRPGAGEEAQGVRLNSGEAKPADVATDRARLLHWQKCYGDLWELKLAFEKQHNR